MVLWHLSNINWISINNENYLHSTQVDERSSSMVDAFSYFELMQFNNISNVNGKILDLILCNKNVITNIMRSENSLVDEDQHHPSLEFSIKISVTRSLTYQSRAIFNFRKANYNVINATLAALGWEDILLNKPLNTMVELFYAELNKIIEKHVPSFRVRGNYPIYFKSETIKTILEKNKHHKKYKKYGDQISYLMFSRLRRRSKQLINNDFNSYIQSVELEILNNSKKFWNYVSNKKRSNASIPRVLHYGDSVAEDGKSVSNLFATFFKSVYLTGNTGRNLSYPMSEAANDNILVSENEISELIKTLDIKKSAGPDGVPPLFIKYCVRHLTKPLSLIYNLSLREGCFPLKWKASYVIPIFKSGDRSTVSNYRPISKISIFAKILEKIVYKNIFSTVKNTIIEQQHGFFPKRSLETNLLCFSENVCLAMDGRVQVDAVYTDFSKAFDKISHEVLMERLADVGVCGAML